MRTHVVAESLIDAPAEVVYRCIADYAQHHRPGGFLPPAFSELEILSGGIGDGTAFRMRMRVSGRTRVMTARVTEPEPGRVLVETSQNVQTTFRLHPEGDHTRVRFETTLDARGLEGLMNRLFAARLLEPIYIDELYRLERYAQALAQAENATLQR